MVDLPFGQIINGYDVEVAVLETLRKWMPLAVQSMEAQYGRQCGQIPPPRLYTTRNVFEAYPEDQMPMCIVVSPGITEPPMADGEGTYSAWFGAGVGMIAGAGKPEDASLLSKLYVAAARAILLKYPALKDEDGNQRASGVEWVDESYDDEVVAQGERTIKAAYGIFRVKMENIVNRRTDKPAEPYNLCADGTPAEPFANEVLISQIHVGLDEEV